MRNARLCKLLSDQGTDVVCATISLFHEVHRWNRANIPLYHEIYLRVPAEELHRRDVKGIYRTARQGVLTDVVGLDVTAEVPESPDLVIDNHGATDVAAAVDLIWRRFIEPGAGEPGGSVRFGTKAETLAALEPVLRSAVVLPQARFTVSAWHGDRQSVLAHVAAQAWASDPVIVRSSARAEDGSEASQAGRYVSIPNVRGPAELAAAIDQVIASYEAGGGNDDQVFVQPMIRGVAMAGVAFSRCPNSGGAYFVINYDDSSGQTDGVTGGSGDGLRTFFCLKSRPEACPDALAPVVALMRELESLLACDAIDVEFATGRDGRLYLLQVRPLTAEHQARSAAEDEEADQALADVARKVELLSRPVPFLHGSKAIFGVMPDWNPAEIIGLRPGPLALSLYRELVTDAIWAYQRDNYGYQNLRSFPLLVSFHGLPYIDVRVSFNSFVPNDVPDDLAGRLVNYYIDRLADDPHLHDKVEFDIIYSCYTLDLPQRMAVLLDRGFSQADINDLSRSLRRLTNRIIHGQDGLWRQDHAKIDLLARRLPDFHASGVDKIARIYWLLEDCKRYGTLPFAGLARAGFIAVQMLKSLVAAGVLTESEQHGFMSSIDSVGSRIGRDFANLSRDAFLERYGHLRPGTYDILSPRYDEAPDLYFDWSGERAVVAEAPAFAFSADQLRRIDRLVTDHGLDTDAPALIDFIRAGIEGREYAKFVFTRNLSDALSLIKALGREHGLGAEDCSFLSYDDIRMLYSRSGSVGEVLRDSVARGRRQHAVTRGLVLPPVISSPSEVFSFHLPVSQPSFITQHRVTARTSGVNDPPESLAGTILFVPSADPGFDWIFTRGIAGFITQFGGVNSHMAIRAGELGIPAVIGAGEVLFQRWRAARKLCLDCGNHTVQIVA